MFMAALLIGTGLACMVIAQDAPRALLAASAIVGPVRP